MTTRRSDDADERPGTGALDGGEPSRPRRLPTEDSPGGEASGLRAVPSDDTTRNKRSTPNERPRRRKQLQGAVVRLERHKRNTPAQRPSRMARPTQPEVLPPAALVDRPHAEDEEVTRRASVRALRAAVPPVGAAGLAPGAVGGNVQADAAASPQGSPGRALSAWRLLAAAAATVLALYWLVWR